MCSHVITFSKASFQLTSVWYAREETTIGDTLGVPSPKHGSGTCFGKENGFPLRTGRLPLPWLLEIIRLVLFPH